MLPTADICDQRQDAQVVEPVFRSFGKKTAFAGPITTLKLFEDNVLVRKTLEEDGDGRVLVVDGGGSMRCALIGDRLATLVQQNGWAGVIVYGCIRDSGPIAQMDVGVFALATHPRRSVKRGEGQRDLPVTFAGVTFAPGAFVYADEDGIVVTEAAVSAETA